MVVIAIEVDKEKKTLYMDDGLYKELTTAIIPSVKKKDFDYLFAVDGEEGVGKSLLSMQIAKILDPNFNINNIAFTPKAFVEKIVNAQKHSCIMFDEAFTGLSSRASLSEINHLLVSLMMEMRQKNLFIIIVLPSFFILDRYVALHRAKCLFHVYLDENDRRGSWCLYNKRRMKLLYIKGKKFFDYFAEKPIAYGRFNDTYTINESEYRRLKYNALKLKKHNTRAENFKNERDTLFNILVKDVELTQEEIAKLCKKYGYKINRATISKILDEFKAKAIIENVPTHIKGQENDENRVYVHLNS